MVASVMPTVPTSSLMNVRDRPRSGHHAARACTPWRTRSGKRAPTSGGCGSTREDDRAADRAREQGMCSTAAPPRWSRTSTSSRSTTRPPREPDLATVGRVNDLAYGSTEPKLAPAIAALPDKRPHLRRAIRRRDRLRRDGLRRRHATPPCGSWPRSRTRGERASAGRPSSACCIDARARGQETASLQASAAGQPCTSGSASCPSAPCTSTRSGSPDRAQPRAARGPLLPALRPAGRRSPTRARSRARTAATAPTTTPSRSPPRSRSPPTARSSCSAAPSSRARTCGRSPAASSTSARRSRRPPTARSGRSSTSRSSSARSSASTAAAEERDGADRLRRAHGRAAAARPRRPAR